VRSCLWLFVVAEGDIYKIISKLATTQHSTISSPLLRIRHTDVKGRRGACVALCLTKESQVLQLLPCSVVIAEYDIRNVHRIDECVFVEFLRVV
jgi:hypothetical protein